MITKQCEICDKQFTVSPSQAAKRPTCSMACSAARRTGRNVYKWWSPQEKFYSLLKLNPDTGCHEWQGGKQSRGKYGRFTCDFKTQGAHRWAWIFANGTIPDETPCVCHKCDNDICCNVEHLFLGTQTDNINDRHAKGRTASGATSGPTLHPETHRGSRNGNARIDERTARAVKALLNAAEWTKRKIAEVLNVSEYIVWDIARGRTWVHV